jgi:hypothetical protein
MRPLRAAAACMAMACSAGPYDVKGTALDPSAPTPLPATPSITLAPLGGKGPEGGGSPDGGWP